jgi:hypothetical protein
MDCARTQTNLYVLSLQELSTHWVFCFTSLTKSSMSLAKLQVFASHPARPVRAQISTVLKKHYKTAGIAPVQSII